MCEGAGEGSLERSGLHIHQVTKQTVSSSTGPAHLQIVLFWPTAGVGAGGGGGWVYLNFSLQPP